MSRTNAKVCIMCTNYLKVGGKVNCKIHREWKDIANPKTWGCKDWERRPYAKKTIKPVRPSERWWIYHQQR